MPEDERVVDSTGALLLKGIPKRMLVVGGGIIGLEMATVYSTLGTRIDVVEMLDGLMQGADRDLVKVWEKVNAARFDNVMLKTKTVGAKATKAGIEVSFEGEKAPERPQIYDLVLVAVGRSPNGKNIGADKAGVAVTDRGFIDVDRQMRTNVPHIFAIGDIVGQPMLAHKAVHEAHVAAEAAHGEAASSTRARSRRCPGMVAIAAGPSSLRSPLTCTCRLFSSTTRPGQTMSSSSALVTSRSRRSTSACRTSKARAPRLTGRPSIRSCLSLERISTRPKRSASIDNCSSSSTLQCTR